MIKPVWRATSGSKSNPGPSGEDANQIGQPRDVGSPVRATLRWTGRYRGARQARPFLPRAAARHDGLHGDARTGFYTLVLASRVGSFGRVTAIEAGGENLRRLRRHSR